jgi:hypothetical protein
MWPAATARSAGSCAQSLALGSGTADHGISPFPADGSKRSLPRVSPPSIQAQRRNSTGRESHAGPHLRTPLDLHETTRWAGRPPRALSSGLLIAIAHLRQLGPKPHLRSPESGRKVGEFHTAV